MKIRTGFDIAFDSAQPMPMILMVSVHPSRLPDLLTPQGIRFDPPIRATSTRTASATSAIASWRRRAS